MSDSSTGRRGAPAIIALTLAGLAALAAFVIEATPRANSAVIERDADRSEFDLRDSGAGMPPANRDAVAPEAPEAPAPTDWKSLAPDR